jgi:hypothetical protein
MFLLLRIQRTDLYGNPNLVSQILCINGNNEGLVAAAVWDGIIVPTPFQL